MRTRTIAGNLCAVILGVALTSGESGAAPVDCLSAGCTVSDSAAVLQTDSNQFVSALTIQGIGQIAEQSFDVTPGINSAGNPVAQNDIQTILPLVSATQDDVTKHIVVVFSDDTVRITVTYTLIGTGTSATVRYTVLIENLSDAGVNLALVDFIDYDLNDSSNGDTISFAGDTIHQSDPPVTATARSISSFDFFDVGPCCKDELYNRLVSGHLGGNSGPVGPEDVSGGFQNNIALADSGSLTISRELHVQVQAKPPTAPSTPAPTLSPWGLGVLALALVALGLFALRRQRA
jgi:hypothetical protein